MLWPLEYKRCSIPEELGEGLITARLSLEQRHSSCLLKPTLLALLQQPRLQLLGAGQPEMATLSQELPTSCKETSRGWISLFLYIYVYVYISHAMHGSLSGFSPAHPFTEMWVAFSWSWLCARFDRSKNSKIERKGEHGIVSSSSCTPPLSTEDEDKPLSVQRSQHQGSP